MTPISQILMNPKVCLVHISKTHSKNYSIKLLPLGLLAIADLLSKNKYEPLILNLALEKILDPYFDLTKFIIKNKFKIVLFDLHWHYQSYDVIQTIRNLKKDLRNLTLIVGGFTASFFFKEIMENCKEIDFIIRGDSEVPLLQLLAKLKNKEKNFGNIYNLIWRKKNKIVNNHNNYIISKKIIDRLCFTNFKLIHHYEKYIRLLSPGLGEYDRIPKFYYVPGRGCSVTCSFCGGSCNSQKIINNRKDVILVNINSVIRDFKELKKYNIYTVNICFDPFPDSRYYIRLFKEIKKNKIKIRMDFECFGLPTKLFINEFAKTFKNSSNITISPECGSDNVRLKNKGMYYTNDNLIQTLFYLISKKIKVYLSFTAGLAFEKREDVVKTLTLINFIRNKFKSIEMHIGVVEIEPASPWYLHKEKYGIISNRNSFMDFYNVHKSESSIGYSTEFFSEVEIKNIRRLYQAEKNCIYKKSEFLKVLTDSFFASEYFDFNKLNKNCKKCNNYEVCFEDQPS